MTLKAAADSPSTSTLAWVETEVGAGPVVALRRLTGGTAAATHLLTLGAGHQVVLRRPRPEWLAEEPDVIAGESAALVHAAAHGLPSPELLASDRDGTATGDRPALVMGRLPGRIDLAPRDPSIWLAQMAEVLAAIHAVPAVPNSAHLIPPPEEPLQSDTDPPPWSNHPALWDEAVHWLDANRPPPSGPPPELVHGDFQHFNLLWSRQRLRGVVDWNAPHGRPVDSDLGHCRTNLVILYGTTAADEFLARYASITGRWMNPWWELSEVVGWHRKDNFDGIRRQVGSHLTVKVPDIRRRVDAHLLTLMDRLPGR